MTGLLPRFADMRPGLTLLIACVALATLPAAMASEHSDRAYVTTPYGEPVMTGYGECWRTGYPPQSDQSELAEMCGDIADSDGDGVRDGDDQCPGTPEGAKVDDTGCALDSDGDGVADYADDCPGTAAGRPVDANGCLRDSDRDGVADDRDQCPGTASGSEVDAKGCERVERPSRIEIDVRGGEFGFDSAELKPAMEDALDEAARRLRAGGGVERLRIIGYTDSVGAAAYNRELSRRRAEAVADYLATRGIDRDAMTVEGRGEANPVASNDTEAGRAQNRRVVIIPQ